MSRVLIAPLMKNLGECHRLDKIAHELYKRGHTIIINGDVYYKWLFNNSNYIFITTSLDSIVYNENNSKKMLNINSDFNFLSTNQIRSICDEEINLLSEYKIDLVVTGYRLSSVIASKASKVLLVWLLSGAVSKESIIENLDLILNTDLSSSDVYELVKDRVLNTNLSVRKWNLYLRKKSKTELQNTFQLFEGDLNLVTDITDFYSFNNFKFKIVGPILMKNIENINYKNDCSGNKIFASCQVKCNQFIDN